MEFELRALSAVTPGIVTRLAFSALLGLCLGSALPALVPSATGAAKAQGSVIRPVEGDAGTVSTTSAVYAAFASNTYIRAEAGLARSSTGNAFWRPPGFPSDPQIFFDLSSDTGGFGSLAIGRQLREGLRSEVALNVFGPSGFDGGFSFTVPATPGPHASMSGSTRSVSLMWNVFFEPFAALGQTGKVKPYVMAGLGVARNTMSDWTRTNPDVGRTERTFEGDTTTSFAYALGLGLSMEAGRTPLGAPITVELGYRFFDLGSVKGGTTPLPGSGGGEPVTALNADKTDHVISIGVRIPLRGN